MCHRGFSFVKTDSPLALFSVVAISQAHLAMKPKSIHDAITAYHRLSRYAIGKRDSPYTGTISLREFHNVLLKTGTVPLELLERQVDAYIGAGWQLAGCVETGLRMVAPGIKHGRPSYRLAPPWAALRGRSPRSISKERYSSIASIRTNFSYGYGCNLTVRHAIGLCVYAHPCTTQQLAGLFRRGHVASGA